MTASEGWSREYWARGFRLFAVGVDAHLLQGALRQGFDVLDGLAKKKR
jgi:2-keto-3-deoxy-L-rhamnonate aldolase RhmA